MKNIKKPLKNTRKRIVKIHRILGLVTGVVIFIVSITGCLWVFKGEIESLYDDYKYVTPQNIPYLEASKIKAIAEEVNPEKSIHGVVYGQANEAIEVVFYQAEPEIYYQSLYLNPYTGAFIKQVDNDAGFFGCVLRGHLRLWLPDSIGSKIVKYSVLLFIIVLISGLVLHWPKSTKNWKQRLKFDWNAKTRWKRKNFDLHTVLGFYISSFGFIIAFTGCVMAFNWFYYITYKVAGGNNNPHFIFPKSPSATHALIEKDKQLKPYDLLLPQLQNNYPEAKKIELHYPENDSTTVLVEINTTKDLYYSMDYLFFDQNTLEEVETSSIYGKYKNATFADKVIRMNYDIHIGAIGGIPGKIIAFLTSLVCASLPVTGILLWYGKAFKKRKKQKKVAVVKWSRAIS